MNIQPILPFCPRGVILDMDGVLCDSEPLVCEAACRVFAEHYDVQIRPEDFLPFVATGEEQYGKGVAEKYGIHLNLERDSKRGHEIYRELVRGRLQALPGVNNFLAGCRQSSMRLALATSAVRAIMELNLAEIGFSLQDFDACVTGSEVERRKPNPDLFLEAARQLHLSPSECLIVEDSPNGVQAAKASGARCLGLTTSFSASQLCTAGADWTAPDLSQIPAGIF